MTRRHLTDNFGRFIEEDPGRQSISGSFNPIDEGEWSETAYIQATARFFGAISKNDVLAVKQMIEDGEQVNCRDQVGRTPLHVAVLSNSVDVCCVLIDAGARMTARLVGGRTSLHLAAQMGKVTLVKKMLERSAYNTEKAEEDKRKAEEAAAVKETEGVRMSSEDDWSSGGSDDEKAHRQPPAYMKKDELENDPDVLEDNEEEPDVLDISTHDWDFGLTALSYGILSGSLEVVDALLNAGADPSLVAHAIKDVDPLHPLALTIFTQDEERAAKIAERLIAAQAISSTADDNLFTIFHRIVAAGKTKIVASLLTHDPNAKKVLNSPAWYGHGHGLVFPIVSTINAGDYATLSVLLAHGAKLLYLPEDTSRAEEKWYVEHPHLRKPVYINLPINGNRKGYLYPVPDYRARIHLPIETALAQYDEGISLLASLGAEVDISIKTSNATRSQRVSLLQWTTNAISSLRSKTASEPAQAPENLPGSPTGDAWSQYRAFLATVLPHSEPDDLGSASSRGLPRSSRDTVRMLEEGNAAIQKEYLTFAESVLRAHGATLLEGASTSEESATAGIGTSTPVTSLESGYIRQAQYTTTPVPLHLKVFYDELYEACWDGDNASIRELCLPKQVAEGREPIQIVVQTTSPNITIPLFRATSGMLLVSIVLKVWLSDFFFVGWTPFLVALHRRHWDTARLVLAIAMAQYQPPDTEVDATTSAILNGSYSPVPRFAEDFTSSCVVRRLGFR